jgi:hypothetical protein
MFNHNNEAPRIYIYIDTEGLNGIYSQTVERTEIESQQITGTSKKISGSAKIGTGNLLPINANLNTGLSADNFNNIQVKSVFDPRQKITILQNYLQNQKEVYYEDLIKAALSVVKNDKSVYINIFQKFNMPQFSHGKGVEDVNTDKSLSFIIGQHDTEHDFNDLYFRKTQYTFIMQASLAKTTRSADGMSNSGHDAVFFRGYNGKNVPLHVFGFLTKLSKWTFQIKPFAIWLH